MRSIIVKSIASGLCLLLFVTDIVAQDLQKKDSIISSALKDELKRNMESLRESGYEKPFFMGYRISDLRLRISSSTLGALTLSREGKTRDWNTRIMVGNYEINDENFSDSFAGNSNDTYFENVPIEDDYWGIRRVLWASTNNVYKKAARLYKQKLKAIDDFDIDYKLNDFSKEEPQTFKDESLFKLAQQTELDKLSLSLSAYLKNFDAVYNGSATVTDIGMRAYFENSEGTSLIKNEQMTIALVSASLVDEDLKYRSANLDYFANNIEELPALEEMKSDIDWYMDFLKKKPEFEALEEDYNGPVLLRGQAVAEFFKANLLKANKGIFASRRSFTNKNEQAVNRYFEELEKDLTGDDKLKVGNKKMIVTSHSTLKDFQGEKLIGSYHIDSEGVLPKDSLVLIKDGLIQQKINGRLPAPKAENSSGSKRFSISIGGMGNIIAPGVLKVDFTEKVTEKEILALFNKEIEENDEEEGIVIEKPDLKSASKPRQYFTYNRINGQKEQLRKASYSNVAKNSLKRIIAVSDEYFVYNFLYSGSNYGSASSGVPVSIIVPKTILLKDTDVTESKYKARKMDAIVPKPEMSQD